MPPFKNVLGTTTVFRLAPGKQRLRYVWAYLGTGCKLTDNTLPLNAWIIYTRIHDRGGAHDCDAAVMAVAESGLIHSAWIRFTLRMNPCNTRACKSACKAASIMRHGAERQSCGCA